MYCFLIPLSECFYHILFGQIDFGLGITLGLVQSVGVILGGKIAHSLPREKLRAVVAITLIGVGILMIGRVFFNLNLQKKSLERVFLIEIIP